MRYPAKEITSVRNHMEEMSVPLKVNLQLFKIRGILIFFGASKAAEIKFQVIKGESKINEKGRSWELRMSAQITIYLFWSSRRMDDIKTGKNIGHRG